MECTVIVNTDGSREIQYGRQELEISQGISTYTYVNLPESKVKEIRDAKTEDVQAILKTIY